MKTYIVTAIVVISIALGLNLAKAKGEQYTAQVTNQLQINN
jgi:hypothetical protein